MGDLFSQKSAKKKEISKRRLIGSGMSGMVFHGPISHAWYGWLDHFIRHTLSITEWWNIFPMVAMDLLIFCPIWNAIYVGCMGLVFKNKLSNVLRDIQTSSIPLFKSGLKLWTPANFITYGLVPLPLRVLWCGCVEFVWCIIMSK